VENGVRVFGFLSKRPDGLVGGDDQQGDFSGPGPELQIERLAALGAHSNARSRSDRSD